MGKKKKINLSRYSRERMAMKNRPRKILHLEERVQAICMYDRIPVYQRVASVFKCSWEQIKNVVANRESILQYYARCQTINSHGDSAQMKRNKRINFLGNAMYEFIKRAHYHRSAPLNDDTLRARAIEFRDILKIEKFYPNRSWLNDFKHVYHINFQCLRNLVIIEPPPKSLNSSDIIAHCERHVKKVLAASKSSGKAVRKNDKEGNEGAAEQSRKNGACSATGLDRDSPDFDVVGRGDGDVDGDDMQDCDYDGYNDNTGFDSFTMDAMSSSVNADYEDGEDINENEEGPTINYGDDEYNDVDDMFGTLMLQSSEGFDRRTASNMNVMDHKYSNGIDSSHNRYEQPENIASTSIVIKEEVQSDDNYDNEWLFPPSNNANNANNANKDAIAKDESSSWNTRPLEVHNYVEALQCLKPLELFAINEEDFRAMNLLSQLAELYQRSAKH